MTLDCNAECSKMEAYLGLNTDEYPEDTEEPEDAELPSPYRFHRYSHRSRPNARSQHSHTMLLGECQIFYQIYKQALIEREATLPL